MGCSIMQKNKGGRPRKEIDREQFEKLCGIQCSEPEILDWFKVSTPTLNRWCRKTYGDSFVNVFREKRGAGKVSLRRMQWKSAAEGSVSMQIFLGKNYLGQTDKVQAEVKTKPERDPLSKALDELTK